MLIYSLTSDCLELRCTFVLRILKMRNVANISKKMDIPLFVVKKKRKRKGVREREKSQQKMKGVMS